MMDKFLWTLLKFMMGLLAVYFFFVFLAFTL